MFRLINHLTVAAGIAVIAATLIFAETRTGHASAVNNPNPNPSPQPAPQLVRDIDNPARQPFQRQLGFEVTEFGGFSSFTVPAGKRLVIEYVSASGVVPSGDSMQYLVVTGEVQNFIPVAQQASAPGVVFCVAGLQTRLYAEPGTSVTLGALRTGSTGTSSANISISGYLVDIY